MRRQCARGMMIFFLVIAVSSTAYQVPVQRDGDAAPYRERALATARQMIGRPYWYSGDSPAGFDCSGLVRYSYRTVGIELPHGTADLRRASIEIPLSELQKGDLLFFDGNGKACSHVGIYAGGNRFVHAASSLKKVRMDDLSDLYWKKRLSRAGRISRPSGRMRIQSRALESPGSPDIARLALMSPGASHADGGSTGNMQRARADRNMPVRLSKVGMRAGLIDCTI